ncbi:MAG: type II secretion system F family protein [Halobacteria archaeon]
MGSGDEGVFREVLKSQKNRFLPPGGAPPGELEIFERYGFIRGYFRQRPGKYHEYQKWLSQARMGMMYDIYLARLVKFSVFAGFVGLILGGLSIQMLTTGFLGFVPGLSFDISLMAEGLFVLGSFTAPTLLVLISIYYYPLVKISNRKARINNSMPSAVLFMHTLAKGDMRLIRIIELLGESEDAYGEVAVEFQSISKSILYMNDGLLSALQNAKDQTPSERLEIFIEDMISVLESGGDINVFLKDESEAQIRMLQDENQNYLKTMETMAEGYITLVFAGPIFVIVILIVLSFAGPSTIFITRIVVYAGIPFLIAISMMAIKLMNKRYQEDVDDLEFAGDEEIDEARIEDDPRYKEYRKFKRWSRIKATIKRPLKAMRENPYVSLVFTVPFTGLMVYYLISIGFLSGARYASQPITTTTWLVGVPFIIPSLGLMIFYEAKQQRMQEINARFPNMLEAVAGANENGVRLAESFELVSRRSSGVLADKLDDLYKNIRWNASVEKSVVLFANEVGIPRIKRAMKLVAEGNKSTGRLYDILYVVADDLETRYRMDREQKRNMQTYVIVLFLGVLVFLMIIFLIDRFFFAQLPKPGEMQATSRGESGPIPTNLPIQSYRSLLYHSALIQAFGNSLVMGQLVDNNWLGGLKYANFLVAVVIGLSLFF